MPFEAYLPISPVRGIDRVATVSIPSHIFFIELVPGEGIEPSRHCCHEILSLACLPFHHPGLKLCELTHINRVYPSHMSHRFTGARIRGYGFYCFAKVAHLPFHHPGRGEVTVSYGKRGKSQKKWKRSLYFSPRTFPPSNIHTSFLSELISPVIVSILRVIVYPFSVRPSMLDVIFISSPPSFLTSFSVVSRIF